MNASQTERAEFSSVNYEESVMLLSQLTKESLNLLTLAPSMPCLRHILQVSLRKAVVAIMV